MLYILEITIAENSYFNKSVGTLNYELYEELVNNVTYRSKEDLSKIAVILIKDNQ